MGRNVARRSCFLDYLTFGAPELHLLRNAASSTHIEGSARAHSAGCSGRRNPERVSGYPTGWKDTKEAGIISIPAPFGIGRPFIDYITIDGGSRMNSAR